MSEQDYVAGKQGECPQQQAPPLICDLRELMNNAPYHGALFLKFMVVKDTTFPLQHTEAAAKYAAEVLDLGMKIPALPLQDR